MRTIIISEASRALLAANAAGGVMQAPLVRFNDGRCEIAVDEEVFSALTAIDNDPDAAIRVLCTTGVGRA